MSKAGYSRKARVYIPRCRKNDVPPPTFTIRRLTPLELLDITEKFSDPDETLDLGEIVEESSQDRKVKISLKMVNRFTKSKYMVLEEALTGWENVEDEDGLPIPFVKGNISCLDMDIVNELSEVAQGTIGPEETKNSEPPSV